MASMSATSPIDIIGGVNPHQELHRRRSGAYWCGAGDQAFSTTRAGYRAMLPWFPSHGNLVRVGVEATGSYRAGLTRHLALGECRVGGHRPAARARHRRHPGRHRRCPAALTGQRVSVAKDCCGAAEALWVLCTTERPRPAAGESRNSPP
jgi:transposase